MDNVHFTVYRKPAFAGALWTYRIYISGAFVGAVRNGAELRAEVPRAGAYYLSDSSAFFERNAVICGLDLPKFDIVLKRAGGWRTDSYNEFYIKNGQELCPLPSFHFGKLFTAIFQDRIGALSPDEQTLALCLEFWNNAADDIWEVLASEHLDGTVDALQRIGAARLADRLRYVKNQVFAGVPLPLDDGRIRQVSDRLGEAYRLICKDSAGWEELHRCACAHILSRLNSREYIY